MKFTKTIKAGMEVSYNTEGNTVVFNDTNDDVNLELHMDDFKSAISHVIEALEMHTNKDVNELTKDTSQLTKEDEGRYIEITTPVLNVPVGTLGVIDHVFNEDELHNNDPYVCVASTLVNENVALAPDEFKFTTVGCKSHE